MHEHFRFIHEHHRRWPVNVMCEVLNVSETGYYRFVKNIGKLGKDAILSAAMQEVLDESPFNDNYGVNRMQIALANRGIHHIQIRLHLLQSGEDLYSKSGWTVSSSISKVNGGRSVIGCLIILWVFRLH